MHRLARAASIHPLTREVAAALAEGTGTDGRRQAQRIRSWLRRHIAFLRDPATAELLHDPVSVLLELGRRPRFAADCDDVAMLGAALGLAIGLRARFVILGDAGGFAHVFTELTDPELEEWVELDITRPYQGAEHAFSRPPVVVEL